MSNGSDSSSNPSVSWVSGGDSSSKGLVRHHVAVVGGREGNPHSDLAVVDLLSPEKVALKGGLGGILH